MRLFAFTAAAMAAGWFGFVDNDWLDRRPVERVLYIGHSLVFPNHMPDMVAEMADSAGSEIRYDITTAAFGGASLEKHWKSRTTRSLLAQGGWDQVILQPEVYRGHLSDNHGHFAFGRRLFSESGASRRIVAVSWTDSGPDPEQFQFNASNHRALAAQTGARLIDAARIWDDVRTQELPFSLYTDGRHPTLEGSYLAALIIYAELSHSDVEDVTYVPWRMNADYAALLRRRVQQALRSRQMAGFAATEDSLASTN